MVVCSIFIVDCVLCSNSLSLPDVTCQKLREKYALTVNLSQQSRIWSLIVRTIEPSLLLAECSVLVRIIPNFHQSKDEYLSKTESHLTMLVESPSDYFSSKLIQVQMTQDCDDFEKLQV